MNDPSPILAFANRRTNGELVRDLFLLGYISGKVLDPTFGEGKFYTLWTPGNKVFSDLKRRKSPLGQSVDFRRMPWPDCTFGTVIFDPPYKLNGTSTGRGPSAADARYGVDVEYLPIAKKHQAIRQGITECMRVLKIGGYCIIKCQDQVANGRKHWQERMFADHAESVGGKLVDKLYVEGYRVQPMNGRQQRHAHQDFSAALVVRKAADTNP